MSKTMSKGNILANVRKRVRQILQERLVLHREIPAAAAAQWAEAKADAVKTVALCKDFGEEDEAKSGTIASSFKALLQFFDGPWTGLMGGRVPHAIAAVEAAWCYKRY